MAMGQNGMVNITPEMMTTALAVIEDYISQTTDLRIRLGQAVKDLIPSYFSGSAADGYRAFFENKIDPVIGDNLTQLLNVLKDICEGTLKAIPGEGALDDQLGE